MSRLKIIPRHPQFTAEMLGTLPDFLSSKDPRSVKEQFDANYPYGANWHPGKDFRIDRDGNLSARKYPDDPAYLVLAQTKLRDETILFFRNAWVGIMRNDELLHVARLD